MSHHDAFCDLNKNIIIIIFINMNSSYVARQFFFFW